MSIDIIVYDFDLKSAIFLELVADASLYEPNFFESYKRLSDLLPELKRLKFDADFLDVDSNMFLGCYFF